MDGQLMRRTFYKNARFEVESRIERSRRLTVHNQKENRGREHFLRRNVDIVISEPTPPKPVAKETRRDKLLKWKAQKEAIALAQKAAKKPPFKLGAFQCSTIKDVGTIPAPPKSTVKSTVKKQVEGHIRQAKNPTAASKALAALSDNKRVTRSQSKSGQVIQSLAMLKPVTKAQRKPIPSAQPKNQPSFAPANHVFKPPVNLTFPVTPDVMKRNKSSASAKKTFGWPSVPGIEPLKSNHSLLNMSSLTDVSSTSKVVPKSPVDEPIKASPKKRRSVRLATPKVRVDKEVGKKEPQVEDSTPVKKRRDSSDSKSEESETSWAVSKKISRMSIHSPTPKPEITTPPPDAVPAQFSPFIVTGRGADRHNHRRSRGNTSVQAQPEDTLRAEQVQRFRSLLDTETKRLLELCYLWESLKAAAAEEIPSDAQDMILAAVGQARLLTKDKFQQFKRLVDKFEEGESQGEKMTADDLTGFWEMVQLTVSGLDDRFKKLNDLKNNSWKEEEKVVLKEAVKNPKPVTAVPARAKKINPEIREQSRARIREAIAAMKKQQRARRENSKKETEKSFDGGFFKVESPQRKTEKEAQNLPSTPKPRKSLLQQVLTNSANRVAKSPSVSDVTKMMRVSMMGRRVSLSRPEEDQSFISPVPAPNALPCKSILKSAKSAKRHTVAFQNAEVDTKENTEPEDTAASFRPRRSLRFSVGTKFDDNAI